MRKNKISKNLCALFPLALINTFVVGCLEKRSIRAKNIS